MSWRPPPVVHAASAGSFTVRRADLFSLDSALLTQSSSTRDLLPPISSRRSQSRSPNPPASRNISPTADRLSSRGGGRSRAYTTTGLPQPLKQQQSTSLFADKPDSSVVAMKSVNDARPFTTLTTARRPHTVSQPPVIDPAKRARTAHQSLELPPISSSETRPRSPFPLPPVSVSVVLMRSIAHDDDPCSTELLARSATFRSTTRRCLPLTRTRPPLMAHHQPLG